MAAHATRLASEATCYGRCWHHLRCTWKRMRALPLDWNGVDNCTATSPAQLMDDLCSLAVGTRAAAMSEVDKVVACLEAIDSANALNSWRHFARTSVQSGGKLAHRFSKGPRAAIMPERISAADASSPVSGADGSCVPSAPAAGLEGGVLEGGT